MARFAGIQLEQLRITTNAFLELAASLGRPLLTSERRCWQWLLLEWEAPSIRSAFNQMHKDDTRIRYYTALVARLREVIIPDPVKQIRLQRVRSEHVAEKHTGNYSTISRLFEGTSIRRLNTKEAIERAQLIGRLSSNIATVVHELAMVSNKDWHEARQIVRLSRKLAKLARAFGQRREREPVIAKVPSLAESLEQMKTLNGLMEAVAG